MKKSLKAFTLIELILVIAILGIIMAAMTRMIDPISKVYRETNAVSNSRAVEDGIAAYIGESVRYATNLGIFEIDNSDDDAALTAAIDAFFALNPTDRDGNAITDESKLDIICITTAGSNSPRYDTALTTGGKYTGRVVRAIKCASPKCDLTQANFDYTGTDSTSYMAMGADYYGTCDYYISIQNFDKAKGTFDVIIDSVSYYSPSSKSASNSFDREGDYTRHQVRMSNLKDVTATENAGSKIMVMKDKSGADITNSTLGKRTPVDGNIYIIYTKEE